MKIAFVSDAVAPYNVGGKETRLFEVTTRLAKLGHSVTVYCMDWWKTSETRIENGVTLKPICGFTPLYSGERRSIWQGIKFGLCTLKLVKEDFDVMDVDHMPFFPLYFAKVVAMLKGKKLYATWHEVWGKDYWLKYMGAMGIFGWWMEKLSAYLPDKIITNSQHTTKKLADLFGREIAKKVATVPLGVDIIKIQESRKSIIKSDIIYAGRLLAHKNIDVLIEAVKILTKTKPNIKCLIVGEGPELTRLKDQVTRLKLEKSVIFMGFVKMQEEVWGLMKASKVFVLPSSREGFGLVALEANACGIPVVTVDEADNATAGLDIQGTICKLDATQIAEVIMSLVSKDSKVIVVNKDDWDSVSLKLLSTYENRYALKILQTPVRYYPYTGGVELVCKYLSEEFVKMGHSVIVLCSDEAPQQISSHNGVTIKRLRTFFKITNTNITLSLPLRLLFEDFDVVHTHMPTPWSADWSVLIAWIRRKKSILTIHNDMEKSGFIPNIVTEIYLKTIFRITLKLSTIITIVSLDWEKSFEKTSKILVNYKDKLSEIHNGVDTQLFKPGSRRSVKNTVLFVSILDKHHKFKGLESLFNAIAIVKNTIPNVLLVVVGDGDMLDYYRKLASSMKLELNIKFEGFVSHDKLPNYYNSCDLFVLPSIDTEGFGMVAIEAMSCAKSVVVSNKVGVSNDILNYSAGVVVTPNDVSGISKVILDILLNNRYSLILGKNARKLIKSKYTWKRISNLYISLMYGK